MKALINKIKSTLFVCNKFWILLLAFVLSGIQLFSIANSFSGKVLLFRHFTFRFFFLLLLIFKHIFLVLLVLFFLFRFDQSLLDSAFELTLEFCLQLFDACPFEESHVSFTPHVSPSQHVYLQFLLGVFCKSH